jgi:SAM-dependent methyltransferase
MAIGGDDENPETAKNTDAERERMRAFYERHPYPLVDQVEFDRTLYDHLAFSTGTCADNRLGVNGGRRGRMLIAGCGTREAATWALSLPHFDVDAVDLSAASLEVSTHLCARLGATNVRHRQGNFEYGEGPEGLYDFISSFGVLHHLESPERGLAVLERHLAPGGTMALMVYSRTQRLPLENAQRMIRLLAGPAPTPEHLAATGLSLCRGGAQTKNRLERVFANGLDNAEKNPPQFADTLLNPRERCYTIPELVEFLATAGLEIAAPVQPAFWEARGYFEPALDAAFRALPLVERLEIVDHLLGPVFWFAVRRIAERAPPKPCDTDRSLFWDITPLPLDTGCWPVTRHEPAAAPLTAAPIIRSLSPQQVSIARNPHAAQVFHPIAARMLPLLNGDWTLGDVARAVAQSEGVPFEAVEDALAAMLRQLVGSLAVAAPDPTRCARCPRRSRALGDRA